MSPAGVLNLREPPYSAPADGSDQTAIIDAWLTAAIRSGAIAFAPAGNYAFRRLPAITGPITICGAGYATVFVHLGPGNGITIGQSTKTVAYPWVTLRDFSLWGNQSDGHGIVFPADTNNQYLRVVRVQVYHWGGDGLQLHNSQSTVLEDLVSAFNGGWGIHFDDAGGGVCNSTTLVGGNVAGNGMMQTGTGGGIWNMNASDLSIIGTSLQGNANVNLQLGGPTVRALRRITVSGVHVEGARAQNAVLIQGDVSVVVFQNLFVSNQGGNGVLINTGGGTASPRHIQFAGGELGSSDGGRALILQGSAGGTAPEHAVILIGTLLDGPVANTSDAPYSLMKPSFQAY